jgi:hypothetical protein
MASLITHTQDFAENTRSQWALKVLLLGTALGLLSGCGASIQSRDFASTSTGPIYTTGSSNTNGSAAECNFFDARGTRLQGRVTTYYYNNIMQEDHIRLRVTGIDNRFESSSTVQLKMYRWRATDSSSTDIDPTPLSFVIVKESSSSVAAVSGIMDSIDKADINTMRANAYMSGSTAQDFFNQTTFIVQGVDYDWQAIKIVLYDGDTVLGSTDFLIPSFSANPNVYGNSHYDTLNNLHPFWSSRSLSLSESEWLSRSKSYCF